MMKQAASQSIEVVLAALTGAVVFMAVTGGGSVESALVGLIICCIILLYAI